MKDHKKGIILTIILVVVAILTAIFLLKILNNPNKLTVLERNWVNSNTKNVLNVNVLNDAYVFGSDGTGVFYDFLNDFKKEYNLNINPITFIGNDNSKSGITFNKKSSYNDSDIVFYTDHYVLVSKKHEIINYNKDLSGKTIGITQDDLSVVSNYIDTNVTFSQFESKSDLLKAFDEKDLNYILVPMNYYLGDILEKDYNIVYHFSDIKYYYVLSLANDTFSSILRKFYNTWEEFDNYYNQEQFDLFQEKLAIGDSDIEALRSVDLSFGFVNTSPYEVIKGGTFGGVAAVLIKQFSDFSKTEFNFVKYSSFDKFLRAINNGEMELYFNRYNFENDWKETSGNFNIKYSVIARRDNNIAINSLKSLKDKTVYVEENGALIKYLANISGITIKTYSSEKELLRLNKKDAIIVIDSNIYDYYANTKLDNYTVRYTDTVSSSYTFKVNKNEILTKLIDKYFSTLDRNVILNEGLENHYNTVKTGVVLSTIAKYIIYLIFIAVIVLLILIRKTKKVYIANKIKKDDKLKFIDQLTSLKNRNYLNECLDTWNNNIIYPQTIIVMDLNNLQEINDLNGYSEGDKQIKACANILIRTQLDNSEIMRTDGNEFVIYLVGYSQKQVTNYIHKLNKELDHLPYKNGAEFGYSMITDDIKTIEDALNESVEVMKQQKKEKADEEKN